jgi:predicted aspartyl protease
VNGRVDRLGRALLELPVRAPDNADWHLLSVWIDTAFTGELVVPRATIDALRLSQSSAVMAGLADGNEVLLDTFSCVIQLVRC